MPSAFPSRPWEIVAMDLFYEKGKWYISMCDYYSRYQEVAIISSLKTDAIIAFSKNVFARHGIPSIVRSDNGPQFESVHTHEFQKFAQEFEFAHVTSSPMYAQSNGFIEAMVKAIKNGIKKNLDMPNLLLEYRATPLSNGFSPAELLFGRKIRTRLPQAPQVLMPKTVPADVLLNKEGNRIEKQTQNYDDYHGVKELPVLQPGEKVWVQDKKKWGEVVRKTDMPRSYIISTPDGHYRRNRKMLNAVPEYHAEPVNETSAEIKEEPLESSSTNIQGYVTRTGRVVKKPDYLNYYKF
ncbi:unnamed protein product [Allacma fusca]|uniref:Integrase catalytic domain-containing protein n=1 Tax=Allacma fusca TaxID=39272 RepID=A0A8J2KEQ9_9HEXA|nr:unnamed protein product [Allacma fusca]